MDDASDHLPQPTVVPAQPGWWIAFVSDDDTLTDFRNRLGETVIAWHMGTDCWARPLIAGEQVAGHQDYILRSPDGIFITVDCGNFRSADEAFRALRPSAPD